MKRVVLIAALLALIPAATAAAAPRPNLLVIMTDDQRADGTLTVMPETRRRIGRQGATYLEAHATTPKCCPSRASFFTARYTHNHGVIGNNHSQRLDHSQTVQRLVRRRGYRTAIFGKYLNGWPVEVNPPYFDDWAITNGGFEEAYWNLGGRVRNSRRYTTDLISDRTVRFIRNSERRDSQPWLAWVTPYAPHPPSTPARRHRGEPLATFATTSAMAEADLSDKPPFLDRARGFPELIEQVRDDGRRSLMAVDEMVERLMLELREQGETDDTLVVFTSDNGFMLGEHGGVAGKDLPYPASTRIPLLVRWPGRIRPGRETSKLVTNVDVATTLLRAAGIGRQTDGRSLLDPPRSTLFVESRGAWNNNGALVLPGFRSLRTRTYRYAEYRENGELIFREYYDLGIDPWELENRFASLTPERVAALSARLAGYAQCRGRACP